MLAAWGLNESRVRCTAADATLHLYFVLMNIERLLFSAQLATAPYCLMLPWESVFCSVVFERQGPLSLLPVPWWIDPVPMIARSSQTAEELPDSSDTYVATTRSFDRWRGIAEGRDEKDLRLRAFRVRARMNLTLLYPQALRACRHLAYIADDRSNVTSSENVEDEFGSI